MGEGKLSKLSPRLITFDFGDTLVTSEPSYLERIAIALTEIGHPRSLPEVIAAYLGADVAAAEELLPRAPFSEEEYRRSFGAHFLAGLGLAEVAETIGPPLMQKLVERRPRRLMMRGALELIERLQAGGYRLGIISNNDGYTREKCDSLGISRYFQFILDSTLEGVMKPDPRLFQRALARAGVEAGQVLHVGDLWGCDVMGAQAAGIPAVWLAYEIIRPPPRPGVIEIAGLLELLNHLCI